MPSYASLTRIVSESSLDFYLFLENIRRSWHSSYYSLVKAFAFYRSKLRSLSFYRFLTTDVDQFCKFSQPSGNVVNHLCKQDENEKEKYCLRKGGGGRKVRQTPMRYNSLKTKDFHWLDSCVLHILAKAIFLEYVSFDNRVAKSVPCCAKKTAGETH